jgi:CHAT domain-containing protein
LVFDTFDKLNTAFELAQAKWLRGDIFGAYNSLLEIFTYRLLYARLIDADLKVIQLLADLAGLLGEFQAADDLLYSAISLYDTARSIYWADYTRLKRVQLSLDSGKLSLARDLLQEMASRIGDIENIQFSSSGLLQWEEGCFWHEADTKDRTILFAELYLAMGRLLSALGQYGEALAALHQGLVHAESKEVISLARQTILPLKLAIASAYLEQGNFNDADIYISNLESQLVEERQYLQYVTRCLELSGKLNLLRGNLGDGLKQFQKVQQTCRQLGSSRAVLQSTLNLAHILILLNQTSTALNYLADTQIDALAIKDSALASRAELLINLAHARGRSLVIDSSTAVTKMLRRKQDHQTAAEKQVKLDLSTRSSNYLSWFEDRALAFEWQLSDYNLGKAGTLLQLIKQVFKSTDSYLIKLQIRVLEGLFAYYQGTESNNITSIQQANKILEEVCPQLEEMGLIPELWQAQRILSWCCTKLKYSADEIEDLTVSTNHLLEQMTSSLTPEDQIFYLLNKWTLDEEYIATKVNQLQRIQFRLSKSPFWLRPWRQLQLMQRLNALVEHIDRYKDTLVKRTIQDEKTKVSLLPPASLWVRLLTHPKDRVTLSFLILPDRVLVVKTGRFLFDFRVIPTTRLEVRNQVQHWYKLIKSLHCNRDINKYRDMIVNLEEEYEEEVAEVTNVGQEVAKNLAEMLAIPKLLEGLPKHIRALTIVPDDILHGFPFAAIVYKGKYLIEHYAISIAYESKGRRSPANSIISKQKALVVGVSNGNRQFSSLTGVKPELKQVEDWLDRNHIHHFSFINCSKATVVENLSQATLLHIACHGTFELNQPDQSGLVFISDSQQQEILSLRELSEMNLTNLRHATLCSCWSADHFILPGRWIISLPETLWRSGTQSILGCLWKVNDKIAVSFMTRFYNYLDEFPRDEALHQTQLDCLNNRLPNCGIEYTDNPFLWAGFNLYGDYTYISHQKI